MLVLQIKYYNFFSFSKPCSPTTPVAGDTVDNDCDGLVDEEALDNIGTYGGCVTFCH